MSDASLSTLQKGWSRNVVGGILDNLGVALEASWGNERVRSLLCLQVEAMDDWLVPKEAPVGVPERFHIKILH